MLAIDRTPVRNCLLCSNTNPVDKIYTAKVSVPEIFPPYQELVLDYCDRCELAWQNPMPTQASLKDYYTMCSVSSGAVTSLGKSGGWQQEERLHYRLAQFLKKSSLVEPKSVLDFGAGSELSLRVVSSEISSLIEMFAVDGAPDSRESLEAFGAACWSSLDSIPSEQEFDLILAFSVLEHVVDPVGTLIRLGRHLMDRGEIWIVVPDSTEPRLSIGEFYGFEHVWHFTPKSLCRLLERAGFEFVVSQLKDGSLVALATKLRRHTSLRRETGEESSVPLSKVFVSYRMRRDALRVHVRERVGEFIALAQRKNRGAFAVIWGVGHHTAQLLDQYPDMDIADAFIDSSAAGGSNQRHRGKPVYRPDEAPWAYIDCVFISSEASMLEILDACRQFAPAKCEVICPYEREHLTLPPQR